MTEQNSKIHSNWSRHAKKGMYYAANIFLPLSDIRYAAIKIGPSLSNHFSRVKHLYPSHQMEIKLKQPVLNFEEAVTASGLSVENLILRFHRRKKLCLTLAAIPALLVLSILIVVLLSGIYTPILLLKAFALSLALLALSAVPFVQALTCTWRLWQLHKGRNSHQERGGFNDFLTETPWLKKTISPWH
jgi:hypothetical protein